MRTHLLSFLLLLLSLLMSAAVFPTIRLVPRRAHQHLKLKLSLTQGQRWFGGSSTSQKALPFTLQSGRASTANAGLASDGQEEGQVLRMLMFGKPGAGKGTLSSRLVKKYDILSFSTGDLLRQHIAEK
jgi:hypothetical protein